MSMFLRAWASAFSVNRVRIGPGSIAETWMPEPCKLDPERVGIGLDREFRRAVGAAEAHGDDAEHRRAHDDAAMALPAHRRDDAPRQIVPAEEVRLELRAQHVGRHVFERAGLGVGAVVEERVERAAGLGEDRRSTAASIESGSV